MLNNIIMRLRFLTINVLSGALENPTALSSRKLLRRVGQRQHELAELVRTFKIAHDDLLLLRIEKSAALADFYDLGSAGSQAKDYGGLVDGLVARIVQRERELGELKAKILGILNPTAQVLEQTVTSQS